MSIPQSGGGRIESRDDLAAYLEAGCKPKEAWRIGTEHEKFGYRLDDHRPLHYQGTCSIRAMLSSASGPWLRSITARSTCASRSGR